MRAVDISSRLVRHSDFPEQETIVIQIRPGHDDMALLRDVAGHLGYTVAETTAAEITRHIGDTGLLSDQYWADDAATGDPEWYRVSMLDKHVLAMRVGSDPCDQEAMRRLVRWVCGEGSLILVFLVDEIPTGLRMWHTMLTAPAEDAAVQEDASTADALRDLSNNATKGPWKVFHLLPGAFEVCKHDDYATGGVCQPHSRVDADFVVAAVNHVRKVLDR
jgi:hypothetical protein